MDGIMVKIEEASSYGSMAVSFLLTDVHSAADAAPGLDINDMLTIIYSQLIEQGYDVKIDDMMAIITISWKDSGK